MFTATFHALTGLLRHDAAPDGVNQHGRGLANRLDEGAHLMLVYLSPGPHTVRGLARVLGVSKPVVTRALNTLGALGYLRRERDQDDRRNVFVVRTSSGADFLEGFKRNLREEDNGAAAHRPVIGQAPAYAHQR
jgi:DNA-binding MarR family transcriptional regulator